MQINILCPHCGGNVQGVIEGTLTLSTVKKTGRAKRGPQPEPSLSLREMVEDYTMSHAEVRVLDLMRDLELQANVNGLHAVTRCLRGMDWYGTRDKLGRRVWRPIDRYTPRG